MVQREMDYFLPESTCFMGSCASEAEIYALVYEKKSSQINHLNYEFTWIVHYNLFFL